MYVQPVSTVISQCDCISSIDWRYACILVLFHMISYTISPKFG